MVTSGLERIGKECVNMINSELMCADVDDMIFDVNDFHISEK